jgi:predicted XRE-type DNA-binding protein
MYTSLEAYLGGDGFLDLGFDDAGERKLRAQPAMRLNDPIAARKPIQAAIAGFFRIPQPHVSELRHYKPNWFSSERLLRFITLLGRDVGIVIRPKIWFLPTSWNLLMMPQKSPCGAKRREINGHAAHCAGKCDALPRDTPRL